MKITIENTSKIVRLMISDSEVPARIWQGETDSGVPVQVYVTRIAPEVEETDPRHGELIAEFERDLKRTAKPRPTVDAIPLRMII